ncbi:MAG: hypothetical protein MUP11_00635, partial [Anaerolineales bacterium]|nr:hypothetical protein [Anaerolineales bacterium]
DLTRAYLLSKQVLKSTKSPPELTAFEDIPPAYQERITFFVGKRFQEIADWVENYTKETTIPLDHFLIRLFGEVLSQNGFGFHNDFAKAQIADQMTNSVKKFRQTAGEVLSFTNSELGAEYYRMVKTGVLANQYLPSWTKEPIDAVLLAPAYTFLLKNKPVDYQFWLDVGSRGWYERIYQPLTNPHVLSRNWKVGEPWRDTEELNLNLENLTCLSTGLIRRCRIGIICCLTETDERGFEQKGLLLQALNKITKTYPRPDSSGLD